MARNPRRYELTIADVKELVQAHHALETVIRGMQRASWGGAESTIAALVPVDQWVCDLFNRCEKWFEAWKVKNPEPAPGVDPIENTASVVTTVELGAVKPETEG